MGKAMNEARFIELLAAYGAELARWPEEERAAADALLEVAPHRIKDIWESERAFDHLLALEKDGPATIALETTVLSSSPDRRGVRRPVRLFGKWTMPQWATGGAIAASLALGFAVGYAGEPQNTSNASEYPMLSLTGAGAGAVFLTAMNDPEN
jgi:hypothetical protein